MENTENVSENVGKTNAVDDILEYDTAYRKKKMRLANYIVTGILTFIILPVNIVSLAKIANLGWPVSVIISVLFCGISYGIIFGFTILWEMLTLWISKPTHKFMDKIRKLSAKKQLDEIHKERVKRIFIAFSILVAVSVVLMGFRFGYDYRKNSEDDSENSSEDDSENSSESLVLQKFHYMWLLIKFVVYSIIALIWPIVIALTKPPLSETMRDDSEEDSQVGGRRKNKAYKVKNKKYKNII